MDPYYCANNFILKSPPESPDNRHQNNIDISEFMKDKDYKTPDEIIVVGGEKNRDIVIENKYNKNDGKMYLVIYTKKKDESKSHDLLIQIVKNKYRNIYMYDLQNCNIFIKCKLVKIMFRNIQNSKIVVHSPIIGILEIFKSCKNELYINIPEELETKIPIIYMEETDDINIKQKNGDMRYILKFVNNSNIIYSTVEQIFGKKYKKNTVYKIGKLIWDYNEQQVVDINSEGITIVSQRINYFENVEQSIIVK